MNLLVGPAGGNLENTNLTSASDPVTDSIVLRFTPPPNAAAAIHLDHAHDARRCHG